MGTTVGIRVAAPTREGALRASEAAVLALADAADRLSTWQAGGALARLNAAPVRQAVVLDAATAAELGVALACAAQTEGAFDPTVGALADAWGLRRGGALPGRRALRQARRATGHHLLQLDGPAATRLHAGLRIEEGGFGKGAALDAALAAAAAAGATAAVIDAGGQLALRGPGRVAIAHPARRHEAAVVFALDGGHVATSGNGEQSFTVDGRRYGHLLDPRRGRPAPIWGSVTVFAERGLAADCLATALYVLGPDDGLRWAGQADVAALFLVDAQGGLRARASPSWLSRVGMPVTDGTGGAVGEEQR
jgi:thiamine biosynthesis lipoprotein